MRYQPVAAGADELGRWCVIALGLSIPISVALDSVLMALIAILWIAGGQFARKASIVRDNPVALAALGLFALLLIALAYGSRDPGDLGKYIDLLLVPVFLFFFQDAKTRSRALQAFCVAAVASIVVSHLAYLNLLADNPWLPRSRSYPVGFKYSITHSLIVGFAAYLFALLARQERDRLRRIAYILLALTAVHNVVFMIIGRTGYVILAALFLYFFVATFGRRGLALVTILGAVTFLAAYAASDTFHERIVSAAAELRAWKPGEPSQTSVGERLEFYVNSLKIIREHPFLGSGTGSFSAAYARTVAGRNMVATQNPHNEYLLIAVQAGLAGLASLLYLFFRQWQLSGRLVEPLYRDLARGLVLTFVIGCLFNSLLLDHTEGLLFAWLSALLFAAPVQPKTPRAKPAP